MVDQQRVAQPVGNRVLLGTALYDKGVVAVEVEAVDDGQLLMAIAEEHLYAVGILAFRLQQVAVCQLLLEGCQHDIIRIVVHIVHLCDAVDMQGVAPDGVLTDIGLDSRSVGVVREGKHLALL